MKRLLPFLFLLLPIAVFAQSPMSPKGQETAMLKGFGLNDTQIAQVFDIQDKTRATARQDAVQLRLLSAQMDKALLAASPNMTDVNNYITQISQTRADLMKTFVGARVQLRQIIGDDNFPVYSRFIMRGLAGNRGVGQVQRPGAGGMRGGNGGMMGGQAYGPMMDDGAQAFSGGQMMDFSGMDGADQEF
jgi:hypothetical protein